MWVRGLKLYIRGTFLARMPVAPHVGAWIETWQKPREILQSSVAPHVGAWIETSLKASRR